MNPTARHYTCPMTTLIVLAHPLKDSLCAHLAAQIAETSAQCGHAPQVLDLYGAGFDPVLSPSERARYYTVPLPKAGDAPVDLEQIERLILVFPTWWFGLPAILKGWIDRSFLPGVAYEHASDLSALTGRLHKLRDVLVVTTLGSPWWVDRFILRRPVRRALKWGVFKPCAPRARFRMLSLYGAEQVTPDALAQFTNKLRKSINTLK